MHELINKLVFSLFKKNSLEDCTAEEIENLVQQYPYYSTAQVLLAAKKKEVNHNDFEKQLTLTSLHVRNPLWLNHLLNSQPRVTENIVKDESITTSVPYEEANNDELVVANPHHQPIVGIAITEEDTVAVPPKFSISRAEPEEQPLVFEPYYRVDYFASQGIKNNLDEKPKDRFGQQLKSFTEWLRTIRKLPPQQIAAMADSGSEEKVVQLATHSLEERDVDTEAMAEVWIKQGHPEKAVGIYQKLSLLNPSKSSYFAVLIENLKKN